MEDELDPDTYGDDFSESGHYASASNDQEDEQHAQKVQKYPVSDIVDVVSQLLLF